MRLCHNSFIVHYGHGNGRNSDIWKQTFSVTSEKFREKWGFDMSYYTYSRKELIAMIFRAEREQNTRAGSGMRMRCNACAYCV